MPFEKAVDTAEKLAEDLRAKGYTVANAVSAKKRADIGGESDAGKGVRRLIFRTIAVGIETVLLDTAYLFVRLHDKHSEHVPKMTRV